MLKKGYSKKVICFCLVSVLLFDILTAAMITGGFYLCNYRLPQSLGAINVLTGQSAEENLATGNIRTGKNQKSAVAADTGTWKDRFQEHFSDTIISTDTVYKSPDISIELTQHSYDSGVIDRTEGGKHMRYGTKIFYTLADIYISNIDCFQTAFAQDKYGIGYAETLSSMSARMKSVLAVNGDSYSNNRHQDNGTIIRNGILYRAQPTTEETCVLYRDGTIRIYEPGTYDGEKAVRDGAWQSWVFGPSLLDSKGNAKSDFLTWDYIRDSHPRTAIGYYEPGHYCLLVVDGRQSGFSRGMFLEEMSQLFSDLGCKAAYNLDGGHCSFMTREAAVATQPYKPDKSISDGIFICESEVAK